MRLAIGISKAQDAPAILAPLERALEQTFGEPSVVPDDMELRTDHGSVYTGDDCDKVSEPGISTTRLRRSGVRPGTRLPSDSSRRSSLS